MDTDIHVYYVDFENAFDKVRHEKLVKTFQTRNTDNRVLRTITNLCWFQRANNSGQLSKSRKRKKETSETRMCYIASSSSSIMINSYHRNRIVINIKVIDNTEFADGTMIKASCSEEFQGLLSRTNQFCE